MAASETIPSVHRDQGVVSQRSHVVRHARPELGAPRRDLRQLAAPGLSDHRHDEPQHEAEEEEVKDAGPLQRAGDARRRLRGAAVGTGHDREEERSGKTAPEQAAVGAEGESRDEREEAAAFVRRPGAGALGRRHAVRPRRSPRMPVGRKMRITMRMPKAMTSSSQIWCSQ